MARRSTPGLVLFALTSAALLALSAGCVSLPEPRPIPPAPRILSPLPTPTRQRVYLPLATLPLRIGKGVGMTYSSIDACGDAQRVGAHWFYNWDSNPPRCPDITVYPMTWYREGPGPGRTCPALADAPLALLHNEPSWMTPRMTPEEGIELTHWLTEECYPTRRFATPAEISTDGIDGTLWMDAWWHGYVATYGHPPGPPNNPIQIMAHHCYSWWSAQACIDRLRAADAWATAHGMQGVIATEGAVLPCQIGPERALAENAKVWQWAEQHLLGYAHFANRISGSEGWAFKPGDACRTQLVEASGELAPLGRAYREH